MIKHFEVKDLFGKYSFNLSFRPDLNVITGKNGSGKTTILKLIWYMLSSNLERTIPEVDFQYASLATDTFEITLSKSKEPSESGKVKIIWKIADKSKTDYSLPQSFGSSSCSIEIANKEILPVSGSSIFFPTFRRIEGGFSIPESKSLRSDQYPMTGILLAEVMKEYAEKITVRNHKFIASISTNDVEELLTRQYASVSDKTNSIHKQLSLFISKSVHQYEKLEGTNTSNQLKRAKTTLEKIRMESEHLEQKREELLQPFTFLSDLVQRIFRDKGVKITDALILGNKSDAVQAKSLSAGEKQMLSFLCYNAFKSRSVVFIDEPEISLHVDWQRILLPTLLAQDNANQFIIATHSPMIYAKYPQNELNLDDLIKVSK